MKDDAQYSFRHLTRQCCFWLLWPKDDPVSWEWLYRVVWADVHQEPGPLFELLLLSPERPPQCAMPFVLDFLDRSIRGKNKRGPKIPLWYPTTMLEAAARMVAQCIEKGMTLSDAVDQVLSKPLDPGPFASELEIGEPAVVNRDTLYNYCLGKTGHGWRQKQRMKGLKNPPRFKMASPD